MHPAMAMVRDSGKKACFPSFFPISWELPKFLVLPWAEGDTFSVTKLLCSSEWGTGKNQMSQPLSMLAKSQGTTQTGCVGTGNSLDCLLAQVYQSIISGEGRCGGPMVLPSAPLELDSISLFTQGRLLPPAAANLLAKAGISENATNAQLASQLIYHSIWKYPGQAYSYLADCRYI